MGRTVYTDVDAGDIDSTALRAHRSQGVLLEGSTVGDACQARIVYGLDTMAHG